jgi:hypothetical protein
MEKFRPKLSPLLFCNGKGTRSKSTKFVLFTHRAFFFKLIRLLRNQDNSVDWHRQKPTLQNALGIREVKTVHQLKWRVLYSRFCERLATSTNCVHLQTLANTQIQNTSKVRTHHGGDWMIICCPGGGTTIRLRRCGSSAIHIFIAWTV